MNNQDKIKKYNNLIKKYNKIFIQKSKLDFELKKIKEKISEFEATNLEFVNDSNKKEKHYDIYDFILDIDSDVE